MDYGAKLKSVADHLPVCSVFIAGVSCAIDISGIIMFPSDFLARQNSADHAFFVIENTTPLSYHLSVPQTFVIAYFDIFSLVHLILVLGAYIKNI